MTFAFLQLNFFELVICLGFVAVVIAGAVLAVVLLSTRPKRSPDDATHALLEAENDALAKELRDLRNEVSQLKNAQQAKDPGITKDPLS